MSTPTTAVAKIPHPHSSPYHSPYSQHHPSHPSTSTSTAANQRLKTRASLLNPAATLASSPSPHQACLSPLSQPARDPAYLAWSDGVGRPTSHPSHPSASPHNPPDLPSTSHPNLDDESYVAKMASTAAAAIAKVSMPSCQPSSGQPSRKRRRSREPDWNSFYRNGLPKEIIVIDDTPEPEANTPRKLATIDAAAPTDSPAHQAAKKRRREDTTSPNYHIEQVDSPSRQLLENTIANSSSVSSDQSASILHTTAPTSLSAKSQDEEVAAPLKRKRTTRQQTANEAKRRDLGWICDDYKPPPLPPKKVGEVKVRHVPDRRSNKHIKVDDDDGHYIVVPDSDLTDNYQITRLLGQGTFGKVVHARDRKRNDVVAIKIIRAVQKYRDASKIELRVLATLKANDAGNRNRCIHLRDCFDYRGHVCIVMDLLGQSIFDFLKGNSFVPFPNSHIQSFARQLFTSIAFLHDLNLIHTDLKPENVLLRDDSYQTFTYNRRVPSSSTTINRQATQRRVLLDTEIRLIDFGSATFQDEYHSTVVSTRHYRAPEIIMGLPWSFPCDIWSIGCILVEFFTGDALFQTHDNLEHLAMMESVINSRIDSHLIQSVNRMAARSQGGNPASKYFKRLKLDYPTADTTRGSRRFVKAMKRLEDIIPSNNTFFKHFLDLLKKIFVYDPAQRITAKKALDHPWFKEMAQADDGTEAAKIRLEKKRLGIMKPRHAG